MKTRIIVDSTSDLLPNGKKQVHVVPLTVRKNMWMALPLTISLFTRS